MMVSQSMQEETKLAIDESLCGGPLLADALSDAYGQNNDERCCYR
jgi:hypothetical protein